MGGQRHAITVPSRLPKRPCSTGRIGRELGTGYSPAHIGGKSVRQLARCDSRARLIRDLAAYVVELLAVGTGYFVLAKIGLTLASINPGASAIWPATGFALASTLVRGYRVGPAILVASFAANVTNADLSTLRRRSPPAICSKLWRLPG